MIEIEKTYLAKYLPQDLSKFKSEELIDIYIPKSVLHPNLRIRKRGDKCEITKKERVSLDDASHQHEYTIYLTAEEFDTLSKVDGRIVSKMRYSFMYNGRLAEVDVFQNELNGLVLVDFEFTSKEERDLFKMPDFCLADVTQETFLAGGMLCGKSYQDIKQDLEKFKYEKIIL